MSNGRMALAVAGGYLFGRFRKARWALALAGAAAGSGLAGRRALPRAGILKSPEVGRLAKDIRGDLAAAGKRAVVTAASSRMDSLSDRLGERASALRGAGEEKPEEAEEPEDRREPQKPKAPKASKESKASKYEDSDRREGRRKAGGTSRQRSGGGGEASKKAGTSRPKTRSSDEEPRPRSRG
jgi:hypothetical protein